MQLLIYANRVHCSVTLAESCQCFSSTNQTAVYTDPSEPIARANGCAVVRMYTGHGINDLFHTAPNIPHYAKNKAIGTMKPGMVWIQLVSSVFIANLFESSALLSNR